MTDYGQPFVGSIMSVEQDWIDYNGHLNMAYYSVLFDRTCDEAMDLVGLGADYLKASDCSFFTLEAHVTYVRELPADANVKVTFQVLDYDAKRIHYIQEMFHAEEGWLSATMEGICLHVDMQAKKSSPFPDDMRDKIAAMYEEHKGLPVPPQTGHRIGIPRKVA